MTAPRSYGGRVPGGAPLSAVNPAPPTDRQLEVLRLVADGVTSRRGLADKLGASSSAAAQETLERLRDRGLVEWTPKRAASVRVTSAGWRLLGLCECMTRAIALDLVQVHQDGGRVTIFRPALGMMTSPAAATQAGDREAEYLRAISHCPWCGRRIW